MTRIGFPDQAIAFLLEAEERLYSSEEAGAVLAAAEKALFCEGEGNFWEILEPVPEICGIRKETVDMVFLVRELPTMLEGYRIKNYPEEIFWDSAKDLTYKLKECYDNRGVWGTFVGFWYPGFYRLERFALGRLQYERVPFPYDNVKGIAKGETAYNCHIPSSGSLPPEAVDDSLRRAKEFFGDEVKGALPVVCRSWMLYPPHVELFPKGSNLRSFAERFEVIKPTPDKNNHDFWRIFNSPWSEELCPEELPEDTSLRRAFKKYLIDGNSMGVADCLLWVD